MVVFEAHLTHLQYFKKRLINELRLRMGVLHTPEVCEFCNDAAMFLHCFCVAVHAVAYKANAIRPYERAKPNTPKLHLM